MTTPRLQREFNRLHRTSDPARPGPWRKLTSREEAELFGDPPVKPSPLPLTFWLLLGGVAFGTLTLIAITYLT